MQGRGPRQGNPVVGFRLRECRSKEWSAVASVSVGWRWSIGFVNTKLCSSLVGRQPTIGGFDDTHFFESRAETVVSRLFVNWTQGQQPRLVMIAARWSAGVVCWDW